jgi:hypothetical protein
MGILDTAIKLYREYKQKVQETGMKELLSKKRGT